MKLRNTTERWGAGAKCLHWTLALAIFVMMALGWIMTAWPKSPAKFEMYFVHKSLGIVILALMVLRLCWRLLNPTPRLPKTLKPYERVLAHGTHALLYLLLLAMPVSGWVINSAANFPLKVFGLFNLPPLVGPDKAVQGQAEVVHLWLFWIVGGLLVLHIGAALKHHFVLRDEVLARMLPDQRSQRDIPEME